MTVQRLVAALLSVGAVACGARATDPCDAPPEDISVVFLGSAYARGSIILRREAGTLVGRARLTRMEGQAPTDGVVLDLAGPAICRDGIVKVELGAGTTEDGRVRILGGELHVVLPRAGFVDQAFGEWRAEVQEETRTEPRTMKGPWMVSTSSHAVAAR